MCIRDSFWLGWALYRLDQFTGCLEPFQQARKAEGGSLHRSSTLHLALAYYHLQRKDDLQQELDVLLRDYKDEKIPRPVFAWLGKALHEEQDYGEAWKYLRRAITPDEPSETKLSVWRAAARSAVEAGDHSAALRPLDIVLQVEDNDYRKAETHFLKGRAHLALENREQARNATEACLALKPQGDLNPRARLQLGEIAMAYGDPDTAVQYFVPVVELYSKDPEMAATALGHAISALLLKDTPESLKIAQRYRAKLEELQKKWLHYHAKKTDGVLSILPCCKNMPFKVTHSHGYEFKAYGIHNGSECVLKAWTLEDGDQKNLSDKTENEVILQGLPVKLYVKMTKPMLKDYPGLPKGWFHMTPVNTYSVSYTHLTLPTI